MKNQAKQQVKSRPPKGWLFLFILSLSLVLTACTQAEEESSVIVITSTEESSERNEGSSTPQETSIPESSEESSQEESSQEETSEIGEVMLLVRPGEYLREILEDLAGKLQTAGKSVTAWDLCEEMDAYAANAQDGVFGEIPDPAELALAGEGYAAPGEYVLPADDLPGAMERLFSSWDGLLSEEDLSRAEELDLSVHEVLTMASIIEFESSKTEDDGVKPLVASVIWNRILSDTPLQMDVTVFYLEEGLSPYRDPEAFEDTYDTYEADGLPPGPICAPSYASVRAALYPEDTDYLFFIYDGEGNYYFAEDYETHLENVEKYLD